MTDSRESDPDPARVVADADVLAADLLVGGAARDALDHVRRHSWVDLAASDRLLEDAAAVVADLTTERLAADWLDRARMAAVLVDHPADDHPALAAAYRGNAAHLLTFEAELTTASANVALNSHFPVSIRTPDAFDRLFEAESLYEHLYDDPYPGPDCDPRM